MYTLTSHWGEGVKGGGEEEGRGGEGEVERGLPIHQPMS